MPETPKPPARARTLIGYAVMLAATVGIYLIIRSSGQGLGAPDPTGPRFGEAPEAGSADTLLHVLIALAVVIVLARGLGTLFKKFNQPAVVGEIIAGIILGPSLLGRFWPDASAFLLPKIVAPYLGLISQVGVILYMFLVGLELDPSLLRNRGHQTIAISHASIITPFVLGALLALWIYPTLSTNDVPFTCFSLFLGVSMSVTAFPVLARILTAGLAIGFIAAMIIIVRPTMVRLALVYVNRGRLTQGVMALVFVALLLAACATEVIGIHAVFGAFALGAVIPHDSSLARDLTDRLEDIVIVLLLPAFFAFTGL